MMRKPKVADPIARLSIVERWLWRIRERRIVEQFQRDQAASLKVVRGKRLMGAITEESGSLNAPVEGCRLTIHGVADDARQALLEISRHRCHIDGVGRYRDAWWIALRSDAGEPAPLSRIVALASHMDVTEA
jgi:hypothetical protein